MKTVETLHHTHPAQALVTHIGEVCLFNLLDSVISFVIMFQDAGAQTTDTDAYDRPHTSVNIPVLTCQC